MKSIINKISIIFVCFSIFLFSCNSNRKTLNESYEYILASDKDDIYENFLIEKQTHDSAYFDQLIRKLLGKDNLDLRSIYMVVDYLNSDSEKTFNILLKQKLNQLRAIPKDSQWQVDRGKVIFTDIVIFMT